MVCCTLKLVHEHRAYCPTVVVPAGLHTWGLCPCPRALMVVLAPACPMASAVDILGSLLAVMARFGSCGPVWECAFAEVRCGCMKATCNMLGRFGCFSVPCPRGSGHGLGPTAHLGEHRVSGGGCRTTHHLKVCISPTLSRR